MKFLVQPAKMILKSMYKMKLYEIAAYTGKYNSRKDSS